MSSKHVDLAGKEEARLARWRRVVVEAARQEAIALVAKDPTLKTNPLLAEAINRRTAMHFE